MTGLGWGVLGTGLVAGWFADDLASSKTGRLVAVASRDGVRGPEFAARYGVRAHGSYEELVADPEVTAVYIGLPNHLHVPWAIAAARAGKHVLCEKPIGLNARQAREAFAAAEAAGVLMLEGFMFRMHPQAAAVRDLVASGRLGEVRMIDASFGGRIGPVDNIRLRNELGGGALMDVGVYGVALARMIAGAATGAAFADPVEVRALAHVGGSSRVDEWGAAVLRFEGDIIASIRCSNQVDIPAVARISGTHGDVLLPNPWQPDFGGRPGELVVTVAGGAPESEYVTAGAPLFAVEADVFEALVRGEDVEAPYMSPADSVGNMVVLDRWRAELGIVFDGEHENGESENREQAENREREEQR